MIAATEQARPYGLFDTRDADSYARGHVAGAEPLAERDLGHWIGRLPRAQRLALMYFAADLNYVVFMRRFPEPDAAPLDDQLAYYAGSVAMNATTWHLASIAGIVLAAHIPTEWGIGFAGTLALLGLTYSMLGDRTTWVPAIVAGAVAVAAAALPLKLNIVLAIATATAVGIVGDRVARRLLPARAGDCA
jgi:predicted branched-subunit amino acid permease